MKINAPLVLASGSERRRQLLEEAGIEFRVHEPGIDDGVLIPGAVGAPAWTLAMAFLKGRWVANEVKQGTVLAADTMCATDDVLLGQPVDADHARSMIRSLCGRDHRTITGVCLIDPETDCRELFIDWTTVSIGDVDDAALEEYIASEQWRGKAGGYNLADRIEAGWPIEYDGDPTTVMGLPMDRLCRRLGMTTS